ncbi:MAG: hypothetical protein CMP65_06120 [Flavobacteriales bacterium]|nr:hypothetical protein [Flavobacteriales bacterium]
MLGAPIALGAGATKVELVRARAAMLCWGRRTGKSILSEYYVKSKKREGCFSPSVGAVGGKCGWKDSVVVGFGGVI